MLERITALSSIAASAIVVASFILLHGFKEPVLSAALLYKIQIAMLFVFIAEKTVRCCNAYSKKDYFKSNWFEIPMLIILLAVLYTVWDKTSSQGHEHISRIFTVSVYLVIQVLLKICMGCVHIAASGKNPAKSLIIIFLVLILAGAGLLMLPNSYNCKEMKFTDALFTATSATCVTGLVVKDTGHDFSMMGQVIILTLIQLGGLGIVIFGAVLALLLGQALSIRESVAMQDLLSSQTLGKIGNLIGFIFIATMLFETAGALGLYSMFHSAADTAAGTQKIWFDSIFHSISAFCNAGFGLHSDSLMSFEHNWGPYIVIVPLIIFGGLGFGVLYNVFSVCMDRCKRFVRQISANSKFNSHKLHQAAPPRRINLQTKIVITVSLVLIIAGAVLLFTVETSHLNAANENSPQTSLSGRITGAFFQSVTARTAGFNTIDISKMSSAGKMTLMVLMFIGGSPSSTAGGIKTVTLAVLVMIAFATLQKRQSVEMFKRTVSNAVAGRAITVTLLFAAVLLISIIALSITEQNSSATLGDISFETASALGTVGLSTGITAALTTAGKLIIIVVMLIGRLGPLTLLAAITFNLKPAGYSYAEEPIIVG